MHPPKFLVSLARLLPTGGDSIPWVIPLPKALLPPLAVKRASPPQVECWTPFFSFSWGAPILSFLSPASCCVYKVPQSLRAWSPSFLACDPRACHEATDRYPHSSSFLTPPSPSNFALFQLCFPFIPALGLPSPAIFPSTRCIQLSSGHTFGVPPALSKRTRPPTRATIMPLFALVAPEAGPPGLLRYAEYSCGRPKGSLRLSPPFATRSYCPAVNGGACSSSPLSMYVCGHLSFN